MANLYNSTSSAIRDISELREAQRQTLQAERLATIGQTAAGIAHEGRNALQRIQACLSLLMMRLHQQPECLDLLNRMQKAQDDLQRLFEDMHRSHTARGNQQVDAGPRHDSAGAEVRITLPRRRA